MYCTCNSAFVYTCMSVLLGFLFMQVNFEFSFVCTVQCTLYNVFSAQQDHFLIPGIGL